MAFSTPNLETEFIITQALSTHPIKSFRKACFKSQINLTEHRGVRRLEIVTHNFNYRETIKQRLQSFAEILGSKLENLNTVALFYKTPHKPIKWVAEITVKNQILLPRPKLKLWGEA